MIYYWDMEKRLRVQEADKITIKKNIDLMSLAQRVRLL